MRRVLLSAILVVVAAACGSSSTVPPAYSCYSTSNNSCEDFAAAPGASFTSDDVATLLDDCQVAGGGVFSSTNACPTSNRVGGCSFDFSAAESPVSVPLNVVQSYYAASWTLATAQADCTDRGGTWIAP